jgi:hypothetical protein
VDGVERPILGDGLVEAVDRETGDVLAHTREALAEAVCAGVADDLAPEMQPAIVAVVGGLQDHQVLAEIRQQRGGELLIADGLAVLTVKRKAA